MQNSSSDFRSLMDQANLDQTSIDAHTEKCLTEQLRQQQLANIVNPVRFFTIPKMEAELGRKVTMEEFCNEWSHRWVACMEDLKTFGIDFVPEYWTDLPERPAKQYTVGLFELAFAGEIEEFTKRLAEVGANENQIQHDLRHYCHDMFCALSGQERLIKKREDEHFPQEYPNSSVGVIQSESTNATSKITNDKKDTNYVRAKKLWVDDFKTYRKFKKFLDENKENIRSKSKGQILLIHAGDYHNVRDKMNSQKFKDLDALGNEISADMWSRKEDIKQNKKRGK